MKIVIDARALGSSPSGVGIYAFNYLKELVNTEHKIILLTDVETSEEMAYMRERNIEIISYGAKVYRSAQIFKYFSFVKRTLCEIQPEIFWEPNILIPSKLAGYRGKVMITIHDMFPVAQVQYFGWKYGTYFRVLLKRTIKRTDIVLYNSAETKDESEHYFPELGTKKNHILYVIVPRIELSDRTKECEGCRNIQGQEYFLYLGNMEKRKGVDLLLDAYIRYRQNGGTKALVLAGKSREKDIDEKIAVMVSCCDKIFYFGYVSDEEKQYLYQNCFCFLFPSMAEGFGICVLEAMNYYKPIIASDLSIFREIVGGYINYFPLEGGRVAQIKNLSQKMLHSLGQVDHEGYDEVMTRYVPGKLGRQMDDIVKEAREWECQN